MTNAHEEDGGSGGNRRSDATSTARTARAAGATSATYASPADRIDLQRRRAWCYTAAALASLNGLVACGGSGGGEAAGSPSGSSPAPAPGPAPGPGPAPAPAPTPSPTAPPAGSGPALPPNGSKYRSSQPLLWSPAAQFELPSRLAGGLPFALDRLGPTADFVAFSCAWPWRRKGGDWLDADQVAWGPKPWARLAANAVSGSTASFTYTLDVSAVVKLVQQQGRWLALMLQYTANASARILAGAKSATPPSMTVVYTDGTQETLACVVSGSMTGSTAYPSTVAAELPLPVAMEFIRPSKPVSSATLRLTITQHWSGSANLDLMLLDPPLNRDPVRTGIAAAVPLDAGLASHPQVIGLRRVADGDRYEDHFYVSATRLNTSAMRDYSPDILGTGARDTSKLPYVTGTRLVANQGWSVLGSNATAPGFQPLAPGVGAIRFVREREVQADGEAVGYALNADASFKAFLGPEDIGRLREAYVRYYVRLQPLPVGLDVRKQVYKHLGEAPVWCDLGGKFGAAFAHDTSDGGVSGTSGGGGGWQMRYAWTYRPEVLAGPDSGAVSLGVHLFDFLYLNPPGHNYGGGTVLKPGDDSLSQRGALGVIYPGHWYCIEQRLKLNSVDAPAVLADGTPHVVNGVRQYWSPDGELDTWIDGRLAHSLRGMVFRTLPRVLRTGLDPGLYLPPIRELGIRDVWHNFFHGGLTKMPMGMTCDIAGLVWAREYIGPMNGVTV